ncbi:hypothetical protein PI124_g16879 [Phytophthora idaei]|nr:hypothetical protein PI125_g13604 [Phytophthora idaei]KAG3147818.1 hypothetical protein PI126_g12723 [Phytophthora idaei]KAG3238151.1 hypothetical protein PI124_g16879 [Phytophthora idaei]
MQRGHIRGVTNDGEPGEPRSPAKFGIVVTRKTFGLSIVELVPKSTTVHFGEKKCRTALEKYMDLAYKDLVTGVIAPLLSPTQSFSIWSPETLLVTTQFSRPEFVLLEKTIRLRYHKIEVLGRCSLAGHHLGEIHRFDRVGALFVEVCVGVVLLRGLITQKAVKRMDTWTLYDDHKLHHTLTLTSRMRSRSSS